MPHGENAGVAWAYTQVEKWMLGSTVRDLVGLPSNVWVEHLKLLDGREAEIAWTTGDSATLSHEHVGAATSYQTLNGRTVPIRPGSDLSLTGSPVLLLYP